MSVDLTPGSHNNTVAAKSLAQGQSFAVFANSATNVVVQDSSGTLNAIQGQLSVVGASATLDDLLNASGRQYDISGGSVNWGTAKVNYPFAAGAVINAGNGGNHFQIDDTPLNVSTTINAGNHSDKIQAGKASGTPGRIGSIIRPSPHRS